MLHQFDLLTIDLTMFDGSGAPAGASGAAPAAGEGSAPAAAEATAPEVRYGKQPEQTAAPQQETPQAQTPTETTEAPDKGKLFKELINGEYKDQYTEATQKLINRRFRDTDEKIKSQQPIMDLLASRYGIEDGNAEKLLNAVKSDTAFWQEAADQAGLTVEQYRTMRELEAKNRQLMNAQRDSQRQFLAQRQYQQWQVEAEALKQKYPDFDLDTATQNEMFQYLLRSGNYPMEQAYKAAFAEQIAAQAAAAKEKAVTDNIKARGNRPTEAGANPTPAFVTKDDVSKLTKDDILNILNEIADGRKVTFG